jgi:tetraacyldisaccharide 4'-kinase
VIDRIYAAGARSRRRFYASHPERQRRLVRPVISVGNVAVGGRAKTPLVAAVASRLLALGERPAILSRGYARRDSADGVVVVREPDRITADVDRAGDEPLMLAKQLDGVAVLACSDRYLAGRLAEHHFGCTVHVLDDGFQHFQLHRDLDLVAVASEDLDNPRTLPTGRLREPIETLRGADAIIALDERSTAAVGPATVWRAVRRLGSPRLAESDGTPREVPTGPALAVAGIAQPDRFFQDLRAAGWPLCGQIAFADHHPYSRRDLDRIVATARERGADLVVTTEKDLVRLLRFRPFRIRFASVPLLTTIEPEAQFDTWLVEAIQKARRGRP